MGKQHGQAIQKPAIGSIILYGKSVVAALTPEFMALHCAGKA
jgi:hypothetical protein